MSDANKTIEKPEQSIRDFIRGYHCAVAVLLNLDGDSTTARDLFRSGGDWRLADPKDIEAFREYGWIDNA